MKKEKENVVDGMNAIAEGFTEKSSVLCIHTDYDNKKIDVLFGGDDVDKDVTAAIATCLSIFLEGKAGEGESRIAEMVLKAVSMVIDSEGTSSARLCSFLQGRITKIALSRLMGDEDDEDCANCAMMHVCESDAAVEFRRENGIPQPSKKRALYDEKVN